MIILFVLVLEKKSLDWLENEDARESAQQYQETIGEEDSKNNYEVLWNEVSRRKDIEDKRLGRKKSPTKVGFAGIDEEGKIDPKEKLKQEIADGLKKLTGVKKKK